MSHRGKKPSHPGHRRRTEADDSVMPSMVPPPTVDFSMVDSAAVSNGAVNSLGFSIPILSSRQADMREGLDNITSRLNRVIPFFHLFLYFEPFSLRQVCTGCFMCVYSFYKKTNTLLFRNRFKTVGNGNITLFEQKKLDNTMSGWRN